jgi:hypothetical protein
MSFQPAITLALLPKTSDSFTVVDATPNNSPVSPTGYGAPNGPASPAAITSLYGQIQAYGEGPVPATSTVGIITGNIVVTAPIRDGVNILGLLYGELKTISITAISSDRLTLTTGADYTAILANVYALSKDGTYIPIVIKSITATTITLYTALPGTFSTMSSLYRYYLAPSTQLVTNQADGRINSEIAALPVKKNTCEAAIVTMDDLMLKFSAQAAFANQNYAKAHQAIRLITADLTLPTSTCTTC